MKKEIVTSIFVMVLSLFYQSLAVSSEIPQREDESKNLNQSSSSSKSMENNMNQTRESLPFNLKDYRSSCMEAMANGTFTTSDLQAIPYEISHILLTDPRPGTSISNLMTASTEALDKSHISSKKRQKIESILNFLKQEENNIFRLNENGQIFIKDIIHRMNRNLNY